MARRLRCPCGNIVTLPEAFTEPRVECPQCDRKLTIPGASSPAKTLQAGAAKTMKAVAAGTIKKPAAMTEAPAKKSSTSPSKPVKKLAKPAPRSKWPMIAAIAGLVLLVGGGTAGWLIFRHKPADKVADAAPPPVGKPDDGKKLATSDQKAPFTLALFLDRPEVSPGTKAQLTIRAKRAAGFVGEIALTVDKLPPFVTPTVPNLAENQDEALVKLELPPAVKPETYSLIVTGKAMDAGKEVTAAAPAFDLVVVAPFELTIEPAMLTLAQGAKATATVTAVRKGGYDGVITLDCLELPKGVVLTKDPIDVGKSTAKLEFAAAADAVVASMPSVLLTGSSADRQTVSKSLGISVTAAPTTKGPFDLTIDPTLVKIVQGGKATIKVTATRKEYKGPIDLDLRNLPTGVTAVKALILKDQTDATIELTAAATTALGDTPNVTVVGTAIEAGAQVVISDKFVVSVIAATTTVLFEYQLDPSPIVLPQGGTTTMRVMVKRKDYQGAILIEMANLPPKVTVPKATIPQGQNMVDLTLTAERSALLGDTKTVTLLGTTVDATASSKVESSPFTLSIVPSQPFDLAVSATPIYLKPGGTATLRVTAIRRSYDGLIAVVIRGLPALVTAPQTIVIAPGTNFVDVVLTADINAKKVDQSIRAGGVTNIPAAKEIPSGFVIVHVLGNVPVVVAAGTFTLIAELGATPPLAAGSTATLKVTAVRKGYVGPIAVEVHKLPAHITATKGVIASGQNSVTLTLTVDQKPAAASKGDFHVRGSGDGGIPHADSPGVPVSVLKKK
jgi:hypothetical protein